MGFIAEATLCTPILWFSEVGKNALQVARASEFSPNPEGAVVLTSALLASTFFEPDAMDFVASPLAALTEKLWAPTAIADTAGAEFKQFLPK